jgi:hypothetical protein
MGMHGQAHTLACISQPVTRLIHMRHDAVRTVALDFDTGVLRTRTPWLLVPSIPHLLADLLCCGICTGRGREGRNED